MSFCIVPGCSNRNRKKNYEQLEKENRNNKPISFHVFPKDVERKNKWLEALNLQNYIPPKTGAICSEHFKEENYDAEHSLKKLKKDAVPYLSEDKAVNIINKTNNINCTEILIQPTDIKKEISSEVDIYDEKIDISIHENIEIKTEVDYQHRSTSISPERIFESSTEDRLRTLHRNEMKKLKNRLYVSSSKLKKARETIKSLRNILKDLEKRNLLKLQESGMLKHLDDDIEESNKCET